MPATRFQQASFSIFMAFAMVYGMELYNQALMAGGLSTRLFLTPFTDIVPLMLAVIVLETLIGGRLASRLLERLLDPKRTPALLYTILRGAFTCWSMCPMMSMVATLAFKQPPVDELIATWLQTAALNFPMALLWQLLIAGPAVRAAVRRVGVMENDSKGPLQTALARHSARSWDDELPLGGFYPTAPSAPCASAFTRMRAPLPHESGQRYLALIDGLSADERKELAASMGRLIALFERI